MERNKSLVLDKAELDFCLYDWLHVDDLTRFDRYADHSRDTFDGMLELSWLRSSFCHTTVRPTSLSRPSSTDMYSSSTG